MACSQTHQSGPLESSVGFSLKQELEELHGLCGGKDRQGPHRPAVLQTTAGFGGYGV